MSSHSLPAGARSRRGCYSIYSYGTCHDDLKAASASTPAPGAGVEDTLDTILAVIRELTEHGVTQAELDRAREQSKANVLMGLESTQSHMSSMGRGELLQGEVLDEDAIIGAWRRGDAGGRRPWPESCSVLKTPPSPLWGGWGRRRLPGAAVPEIRLKTEDGLLDMYPLYWTPSRRW